MNKAGIQGYAPIRVMNNTPPIRPAATVPITSSDTNMRSPSHPDGHRHLTRVTPQTLEDHFTVPSNLPIMAPQMWNTQGIRCLDPHYLKTIPLRGSQRPIPNKTTDSTDPIKYITLIHFLTDKKKSKQPAQIYVRDLPMPVKLRI